MSLDDVVMKMMGVFLIFVMGLLMAGMLFFVVHVIISVATRQPPVSSCPS